MPLPNQPKLALFDLDNTLLSGDSDYEWGRFLAAKGVVDRAEREAKNQVFYDDYKAGRLDITAFLAFQLQPLAAVDRAELDRWHAEFLDERIKPLIGAAARDLVQRHRAAGDICAVVTATNSFVTGPIIREFGIDHLIATVPACENGRFNGKVRGEPAFREGKVTRVTAWLEALGLCWQSLASSHFYSDSLNDLPLLEKVSHPVAVDPDATLRAHASAAGWPIISLAAA